LAIPATFQIQTSVLMVLNILTKTHQMLKRFFLR